MSKVSELSTEQTQTLEKLVNSLPEILEEAEYDELFGQQLTVSGQFYNDKATRNLLFKFLKANNWNYDAAKEQLSNTLEWRKEFNPLSAAFSEVHDHKFDKVCVVTQYGDEVTTWNMYGASSGVKATELFKDLDKFLRFRIGAMERSLQLLDFASEDKDYMNQLHDYEGVSFLKFDADIKKGSKATIQIFQDNYPELLKRKLFVNVPTVMYWVYELVKRWLSKDTTKKFTLLSNSKNVVKTLGDDVPEKYGGKGKPLLEQNVKDVYPSPYAAYLLQQAVANEVE
ncbi:CYFA0S20e01596g1_1 [Cyberlindnera fabianii]|uniref:Phosphatidylinositol transfer protein SFH5 n=1 Tax=Cyberlindnera fabianii TaxID=36022 RepID=A0A061BDF0_CYBFA|nr:Phosphatidylinositol transfer protein SFH5 [Cyberlindnera fabianii]CDR45906.1 CYFA0S20e01596g1_1 [Cyberlindnera fabianii]